MWMDAILPAIYPLTMQAASENRLLLAASRRLARECKTHYGVDVPLAIKSLLLAILESCHEGHVAHFFLLAKILIEVAVHYAHLHSADLGNPGLHGSPSVVQVHAR